MDRKSNDEIVEGMMRRPIPKKKVVIVHLQMVREGRALYGMTRFTDPGMAAEMVWPLFEMADREMALVLSLNTKLEPQALEIAAVGGLNACSIDCRDIFKHAVLNNAAFIICFHNHPSGDPKPSMEDRKLTKRLEECGKILGIPLIDHIIVGEGPCCYSFKEQGMLSYTDGEVA